MEYKIKISGSGDKWSIITALKTMIQEVEDMKEVELDNYVYEDQNIQCEIEEK